MGQTELHIHLAMKPQTDGGGCFPGLRNHHSWSWMSWSFLKGCDSEVKQWYKLSSLSQFTCQAANILSSVSHFLKSNLTLIRSGMCLWPGPQIFLFVCCCCFVFLFLCLHSRTFSTLPSSLPLLYLLFLVVMADTTVWVRLYRERRKSKKSVEWDGNESEADREKRQCGR